MRYEIDESTFAVKVFSDGEDAPFLFQPDYPNGDAFSSVDEATTWAEAFIASVTDPAAPFAPNGKGMAGDPKPVATPTE